MPPCLLIQSSHRLYPCCVSVDSLVRAPVSPRGAPRTMGEPDCPLDELPQAATANPAIASQASMRTFMYVLPISPVIACHLKPWLKSRPSPRGARRHVHFGRFRGQTSPNGAGDAPEITERDETLVKSLRVASLSDRLRRAPATAPAPRKVSYDLAHPLPPRCSRIRSVRSNARPRVRGRGSAAQSGPGELRSIHQLLEPAPDRGRSPHGYGR